MSAGPLLGPPHVQRRLAALASTPVNFEPAALEAATTDQGWTFTELVQPLPSEPPGEPQANGSWQLARGLMAGYEFADPSIVHAYYDPEHPLENRNMLLKLQALGVAHLYVGVRVNAVYEERRERAGQTACVWGWSYQTLKGHVEMGQMHWEVWKWLDTGAVEFRVHAISREAPIRNPVVRLGFRLVRGHERDTFLQSTQERMLKLTEMALSDEADEGTIREAAAALTARSSDPEDPAHAAVAAHAAAERPR
jgi:uncharacterized protein (UPF0548 family)